MKKRKDRSSWLVFFLLKTKTAPTSSRNFCKKAWGELRGGIRVPPTAGRSGGLLGGAVLGRRASLHAQVVRAVSDSIVGSLGVRRPVDEGEQHVECRQCQGDSSRHDHDGQAVFASPKHETGPVRDTSLVFLGHTFLRG